MVKKVNEIVQTYLYSYVINTVDFWDNRLSLAEFNYNTIIYKSMKVPLFEADQAIFYDYS
jgi:hypothetical protein